jgi:hypothetical protein
MAVFLSPVGGVAAQFFTNTGAVLTGGKLYTYAAGTTTPLVSYTTSAGAVARTNPIVLDAAGRVPDGGEIWITSASYKFVLKDSNDVLIATYDNVSGINSQNAEDVIYDPPFTGAVQTNVEASLANTIYVTDFGAKKDGTDPSGTRAAIQAAIDYAQNSGNVHCIEFPTGNYAVNATINIKGNFGYGLLIKGNKSTVISSHNGVLFDCDSSIPSPAPAFRLQLNISDMTIVGPGRANVASVGVKMYGANFSLNNVYITGFFVGMFGAGTLISEFLQCNFYNCETGTRFTFVAGFAPNDTHFYKCNWVGNIQAHSQGDFDYGAVTFIGCEIEGNNQSGNATDGVQVCAFAGAGEVTFIGCHFESNPGQFNIIYDSPFGRHLNIIGCKIIPGDTCGYAIYIGNGDLYVNGSHIEQAVGQNIYISSVTDGAVIIGETGGTINGTLDKLIRMNRGRIDVGGVNPGATLAGIAAKGSLGVGSVIEGFLNFNNSSGTRLGYLNSNTAFLDASAAYTIGTGIGSVTVTRAAGVGFGPGADNTQSLGEASFRWSQVFAGNGTINTSDERAKQQIEGIPQAWLDAWGDVDYMRFKFNDAVEQKGDNARWHIGLIAQRVKEAFEARGIDPFGIGLLCFDQWDDIEVEKPLEDENGNLVIDEKTGKVVMQKKTIKIAGDQYGIRYEQALALECAYLRNKLKG